jgi:hypothetical protein
MHHRHSGRAERLCSCCHTTLAKSPRVLKIASATARCASAAVLK